MRKALVAAMAAVTFGGAVAATALPAQAQAQSRYYSQRDYRRHHDNNDAGVAIAAGVLGLALGAALASSSNRSSRGYYSQGYGYNQRYGYSQRYAPVYGQGYGYQVCESRRRVYDPYLGRRVVVRERYAC